jgi:dTDP-glucose pyrophosphorylase
MEKSKLKSLLVTPELTMKQAMQRLDETAEKIIFVVDENEKLLGSVTDGDLRRGIISGLKFTDDVGTIMHRNPTSVILNQSDTEDHIRNLMIGSKFEQIPVLDDAGRIVDVVLWVDIIKDKRESKPNTLLDNQVIIMAGGKGKRLDPFTKILPKPLIPIGNKPAIEIIMERFYSCGFHRFAYTLNYKKEYMKLFLKENIFPYEIYWVEEDDFLGTAGGLWLLKDKINDTFFVTNCDSILSVDFEKVLKWHRESEALITVIGCHNEVKIPFGVLEISDGRLKSIAEKPVQDVIINTGVYVMEPRVLSFLSCNGSMDMDELLMRVAEVGKISVFPLYSGWLDIGQWEEYKKAVENIGGEEGV